MERVSFNLCLVRAGRTVTPETSSPEKERMDGKHEKVIEREEGKGSQTNECCVYTTVKSCNRKETYTRRLSSGELITF